jgi:hypothetical protein
LPCFSERRITCFGQVKDCGNAEEAVINIYQQKDVKGFFQELLKCRKRVQNGMDFLHFGKQRKMPCIES